MDNQQQLEAYVDQELKKANINFFYVDEVVAYFGKHGAEWKAYINMLNNRRQQPQN